MLLVFLGRMRYPDTFSFFFVRIAWYGFGFCRFPDLSFALLSTRFFFVER